MSRRYPLIINASHSGFQNANGAHATPLRTPLLAKQFPEKKYDWTIFQSQSKPCAEIIARYLYLPSPLLCLHRRRLWFPTPAPGAGQTAGREGQGLAGRRCTKIPPKSWHSSALIQGTCSFAYSIPLTLLSHPGTPLPQVPTPYPSCCTPSMSPTHPCLIRIPAAARIPTLQTHRTPHPCSTHVRTCPSPQTPQIPASSASQPTPYQVPQTNADTIPIPYNPNPHPASASGSAPANTIPASPHPRSIHPVTIVPIDVRRPGIPLQAESRAIPASYQLSWQPHSRRHAVPICPYPLVYCRREENSTVLSSAKNRIVFPVVPYTRMVRAICPSR